MLGLATHIGTLLLALAAPADSEVGDKGQEATARTGPVSLAPDHGDGSFTQYYQARVEGRVTIRITPRRGGRTLSSLPSAPMSRQMRAVPIARCLPLSQLAGVQVARNNTLLLYLHDRRVVMANLERSCLARDFYSGFYISPPEDGQICVDRDMLQSRTGAKCKVSSWQGLEVARD